MGYPFVLPVFLTTLFLLVSGSLGLTQRYREFTEAPLSIARVRAVWPNWRSSSCYPGLLRNILGGPELGGFSRAASPLKVDFHCFKSLGTVGTESNTFFSLCRRICKSLSGINCRIERKNRRKFLSRCKTGSTLGSVGAPSCCFYRRCLQFFRPATKGVKRFWWRNGGVRRMLRKNGCCKYHTRGMCSIGMR